MLLNETELRILKALSNCSFLLGSFDKKMANSELTEVSPLQQWNLHRLCVKYRKQINDSALLLYSQNFLRGQPEKPLSRRDAEKLFKKSKKANN